MKISGGSRLIGKGQQVPQLQSLWNIATDAGNTASPNCYCTDQGTTCMIIQIKHEHKHAISRGKQAVVFANGDLASVL